MRRMTEVFRALGLTGVVVILAASAACVSEPGYPAAPPPRPETRVFVYPLPGQSADLQDRDRYECHNWAVRQTGFDPSAPYVPPHLRVVVSSGPPPGAGIATGAVAGAVIGAAISSPWESGQGALLGAIAGAAVGGIAESAAAQQAHEQAEANAEYDGRPTRTSIRSWRHPPESSTAQRLRRRRAIVSSSTPRTASPPHSSRRMSMTVTTGRPGQSGFDPTLPGGGVPADQATQKRSDHFRADVVCLEGRGYTVR